MSAARRILRDKCQEPSMTKTLQHITALQRLQNCNIEVSNLDYRAINISPNSVIYCDITYADTKKYTNGTDFDYKEFFQWCKIQTVPVYVSSYQISYPGFELVEKSLNES